MKSLYETLSNSSIQKIVDFLKSSEILNNENVDQYIKAIKKYSLKNDDNLLNIIKHKFNSKTDQKIIINDIVEELDNSEINNFIEFISKSKLDINDNNLIIDFNEVIENIGKTLKIDNNLINNFKKLFLVIANESPSKIGKYEFALRLFFNNVKNALKEDIQIDDTTFEVKCNNWAVKSDGCKSAKECDEAFLEVLGLTNYKSKIFTKKGKNHGIFNSHEKLKEFNNTLINLDKPISKEKLIEALKAIIIKRCDINENNLPECINTYLDNIIIKDEEKGKYILRIFKDNKHGRRVSIENDEYYVEKLLMCCDFYNLIKDGHKHILNFESTKNPKCIHLDFSNSENLFESIWNKIIISSNNKDYYYTITTFWGYSGQEQNLPCSLQLHIKDKS